MDLPTHFFFGIAVALVFFGRPEIAFVVGLGALLPDLDREYWFIPVKKYAEEQRHRALFHNVLVIAGAYVASPFLSLGVFLHVLQDSFTTVKDRGVEWFFPFTRWVKRGWYDANAVEQPHDPKEHVYFYQEDPPALVKLADPDLQEPNKGPVPWRRVYGFAKNSNVLDRGFLFSSLAVMALWFLDPANAGRVSAFLGLGYGLSGVGLAYLAVVVLFAAGETQSNVERARQKMGLEFKPDPTSRLRFLKPIQVPLLGLGLVLLAASAYLSLGSFVQNLRATLADPLFLFVGIIAVVAASALAVKWQTRGGKTTMV